MDEKIREAIAILLEHSIKTDKYSDTINITSGGGRVEFKYSFENYREDKFCPECGRKMRKLIIANAYGCSYCGVIIDGK